MLGVPKPPRFKPTPAVRDGLSSIVSLHDEKERFYIVFIVGKTRMELNEFKSAKAGLTKIIPPRI